jgi:pyruvate dehydrogenase E2 component (dihydrolipoamide acetyltransferase)
MGRVTLLLPRLGETMEEAKVTEWIVAPGDAYARGDVLLEVETDKTVVEVPALSDGTLIKQLVAPGDTVALDGPIAEVEQDGEATTAHVEPAPTDRSSETPNTLKPAQTPRLMSQPTLGKIAASPAARAAARRGGVSLSGLTGSGRRGRITAQDVNHGAGTVVLLHGLFDDSKGWRGLPQRLAKRSLTCVVLDLPGHGDDTSTADSFDAAADQLAKRLPAGPLHLVGHSLGAAFAARLATLDGVSPLSLTLFAPAGLGSAISADFLRDMGNADTAEALKTALVHLDAGPMSDAAISQQLPRHVARLKAKVTLANAVAQNGVQQIDATGDIAAAPCPVAVMFGTSDRILDWRNVAHLPAEARIHLIPNAGHLPHLVRPDLAAALIASGHDLAQSA